MSFIIDPYRYVGCPAEALAFIAAAGITDATQKQAICTLVSDLKAFGIYNKMIAVYPFIGGTSTTHKYNLINPLDTNAAFRLVFSGGGTHASTGWTPNGVNGFADTFLAPSTSLSQNDVHLSYYSRTDVNANQVEIGCSDYTVSPARALYLLYRYGNDRFKALNNVDVNTGSIFSPTNGMLIGSRITSSTIKYYYKGSLTDTLSATSTATNNRNIILGAQRQSTTLIANYSTKECAFASIGDGLTDTEAANLYTAVQKYQTTLGRQV